MDHSRYNIELARTSAIAGPAAGAEQPVLRRDPAAVRRLAGVPRQHERGEPDHVLPDGAAVLFADHGDRQPVQPGAGRRWQAPGRGVPAGRHAARTGRMRRTPSSFENPHRGRERPRPPPRARGSNSGASRSVTILPGSILHDVNFVGRARARRWHSSGTPAAARARSSTWRPSSATLPTRRVLIDGREDPPRDERSLHRADGDGAAAELSCSTGTVIRQYPAGGPPGSDGGRRARAAVERLGFHRFHRSDAARLRHRTSPGRGAGLSVLPAAACLLRPGAAGQSADRDPGRGHESSIDALTEAPSADGASDAAARESFVVAHRLSTIRTADLLLVLDQGRIIERSTMRASWPRAEFMQRFTGNSSKSTMEPRGSGRIEMPTYATIFLGKRPNFALERRCYQRKPV